jgi:peptide/nickel transport system permease protein
VRAEAMVVRNAGYVRAAVAIGSPPSRYLPRTVLPNSLTTVAVLATLGVGTSIISASGLSFLGLGPEPPTPEWGLLLASARDLLAHAWWTGFFPGLVLAATVVSVTLLGRRLKAHLDGVSA